MTPEAFRQDPYLRTTGYNFFVWAAVNLLVVLPLFAALDGRPWPGWLALLWPFALIGGGIFGAVLNDNRVRKMYGDPAPVAVVEAGRLWLPVLLIAVILTVLFVARGPVAYVQPLWLLLVGGAYLQWGTFTVREFRWLGLALIGAGAVSGLSIRPEELGPTMPSAFALKVWVVFMGLLWIGLGFWINRRYLHAPGPASGAAAAADSAG
jgi:hypothetical protein